MSTRGWIVPTTSLTQHHRHDQIQLRQRFTLAFIAAFRRLLDPSRVDATAPIWLAVAEQTVTAYRHASAQVAGDYYRHHRDTALPDHHDDVTPILAGDPNTTALRTSLLVTGPVAIKTATGNGRTLADAVRIAETRCEAAGARHVLGGGRGTITGTAARDPAAVGWARVTGPAPCWLCAMQASRGPDFKTRRSALLKSDGQVYHDGCACTVEPVYSRSAPWPGDARDYRALWNDVAKGKEASAARRAFRAALDARSDTRSPAARRDARAQAKREREQLHPRLPDATEPPRDETPSDIVDAPGSGDPLDGVDLAALSDDDLFELFGRHADRPDVLERLAAEMDSRDDDTDVPDTDVAERTPEQQHIDALVAEGWDWQDAYSQAYGIGDDEMDRQARAAEVDAQRRGGETRDDAVRRLYDELITAQYVDAETACRGHLLSKAGQAEGIDPFTLFSGPTARARKYASEDLQRWWAEHGRVTFTEYRAQVLGRDSDRAAAAVTAQQSNGRDFI